MKKMRLVRRIITLMLTVAMLLGLSGCFTLSESALMMTGVNGEIPQIDSTAKDAVTEEELLEAINAARGESGKGEATNLQMVELTREELELIVDVNSVIAIPANGHGATEVRDARAASCTEAGYSGDTYCTVCGIKNLDGEAIAAKGHKAGAWKVVKQPTTSKTGLKEQRCKVCNALLDSEVIAKKKPAVNFTDVKKSDFYYDAVQWAVIQGVTTGTGKTTFGPAQSCTRAQAVTFLWRAAGSPAPKGSQNPFTDIKKSDYFYKAVLWAVEKGVTKGTSATEFSPEESCTRGQIVTFLWRAQSGKKVSAKNPFTDVKSSDYYYNAVLWAVKNGVTTGTSATKFSPGETCTRGQIVTFLYRAMVK